MPMQPTTCICGQHDVAGSSEERGWGIGYKIALHSICNASAVASASVAIHSLYHVCCRTAWHWNGKPGLLAPLCVVGCITMGCQVCVVCKLCQSGIFAGGDQMTDGSSFLLFESVTPASVQSFVSSMAYRAVMVWPVNCQMVRCICILRSL